MSNMLVKRLDDLAREINQEAQACEAALAQGMEHALKAGRLLLEAKALIPHGGWLPFVEQQCGLTARTAQGYMRVARHWPEIESKYETVAHLSLHKALELLRVATSEEKKDGPPAALPSHRPPVPEMRINDDEEDEHSCLPLFGVKFTEPSAEWEESLQAAWNEAQAEASDVVSNADLVETLARLEWNGKGDRGLSRLPVYRLVRRFHDAWNPETTDALRKERGARASLRIYYLVHGVKTIGGSEHDTIYRKNGEPCHFSCCDPKTERWVLDAATIFLDKIFPELQ